MNPGPKRAVAVLAFVTGLVALLSVAVIYADAGNARVLFTVLVLYFVLSAFLLRRVSRKWYKVS